jgi:metal-responsive CopG/Arc/MetJ family transcriptional regulator
MVAARLPAELVVRIERWADANETSRSEAIRRLVEQALATMAVPIKGKRK